MRRHRLALDVSNVNPITLRQLQASGAALLIAKGTEGTTFVDRYFELHRQLAARARIGFGGYLYLRVGSRGSEADYYLEHVRPRPGELPPIVDAEDLSQGAEALAKRTLACLHRLEQRGYTGGPGRLPILYGSSSTILAMVAVAPGLRRYPVWEAQYPGRFARWFPWLAAKRTRLRHGLTVVLWQWSDTYLVGGHAFDASRLMIPLRRLQTPS